MSVRDPIKQAVASAWQMVLIEKANEQLDEIMRVIQYARLEQDIRDRRQNLVREAAAAAMFESITPDNAKLTTIRNAVRLAESATRNA